MASPERFRFYDSDPPPRRASRKVLAAAALIAGLVVFWGWQFYPGGRFELQPQGERPHDAFVEGRSDADGFYLHVSDWPWTFFAPASFRGYLMREDGDQNLIYWSGDGSVVAMKTADFKGRSGDFIEAYDYREHRFLPRSDLREADICQHQIAEIFASRGGGRGIFEDILNGHPRTASIPNRVWELPLAIVLVGSFLSGHFRKYW